MGLRSLAGQYKPVPGSSPDLMPHAQQAFDLLQGANIPALLEIDTASNIVRVLVEPQFRDAARAILKEVLPSIPRRMALRVDAGSLRQVSPVAPVLLPGDEVIIGRSRLGVGHEKLILIEGDSKIANQHLRVRWDGLTGLEAKDIGGKNDALVGTVAVGPEWFEIEPGARIRIGDTFLAFTLGEPEE